MGKKYFNVTFPWLGELKGNMKICFAVIGNRRSGTTHLNNLLRSHPQISSIVEPFTLNIADFRKLELDLWDSGDYDASSHHRIFSKKRYVVDYITELRQWIYNSPCLASGFKEVTLQTKILWLKSFIPEVKIVYIVRDPRSVVASHVNRNIAKKWDYRGVLVGYLKRCSSQEGLASSYNIQGSFDDDVTLAAFFWKVNTSTILRARKHEKMITVKIEDLALRPDFVLTDLMSYLGMPIDGKQQDYLREHCMVDRGGAYSTYRTKVSVVNRWKTLPHKDIEKIEEITKEERTALGYTERFEVS